MDIKSVMLFGYDFPHKKTTDFIFRLLVEGIKISYVLGAPWVKLPIPNSSLRTSPINVGMPHPRDVCKRFGIKYLTVNHNSKDAINYLKDHPVDLNIVSGARILLPDVICAARKRIINIHPGLLPQIRGLDTLLWSIHHDIQIGITAHFISPKIDSGRLIYKEQLVLNQKDTPIDVSLRLLEKQPDILVKAIELLRRVSVNELENLDFKKSPYNTKMTKEEETQTVLKFPLWLNKYSY